MNEENAVEQIVDVVTEPVPATAEEKSTEQAETVEKQPESTPEQDAKAAEDAKQKAIQKRFDRLTKEKYEAKARADYLEGIVNQGSQKQQESKQDGRPQQSQYSSAEDFVEALTDWKLEQREQVSKQAESHKAQQSEAQKIDKIFSDAEALGDFDRDDFAESVKITQTMADAIKESDVAAKVVAHLYANPEEAERIAGLSNARQAVELGKLEVKLSATQPKVSKAPPPIDPIGKGKASNESLDTDDMEAFIAQRRKQGARY